MKIIWNELFVFTETCAATIFIRDKIYNHIIKVNLQQTEKNCDIIQKRKTSRWNKLLPILQLFIMDNFSLKLFLVTHGLQYLEVLQKVLRWKGSSWKGINVILHYVRIIFFALYFKRYKREEWVESRKVIERKFQFRIFVHFSSSCTDIFLGIWKWNFL